MLLSQKPATIPEIWAQNADPANITTIPQTTATPGRASLDIGFPPINFLNTAAGGIPPFGQDFNGAMNQIYANLVWMAMGGVVPYSATLSSDYGGYPNLARVSSNVVSDDVYMSTADNNTTDPDSSTSANWVAVGPGTGDVKSVMDTTARNGWVPMNGGTIGSASSGATTRANADTKLLFRYLWNNFSNTICPVSSGRGANADADFNANKTITLLDLRGRGLIGVDTMGGGGTSRLASVPVVFGSATVPGSVFGENLHQLTTPEIPAHTHTATVTDPGHTHGITDPGHIHATTDPGHTHTIPRQVSGSSSTSVSAGGNYNWDTSIQATSSSVTGISINSHTTGVTVNSAATGISVSNANTGGGGSHNNVQLSMLVYWLQKL